MTVPPIIAITSPTMTYATAIFHPKTLISKTREPKSTKGEDMRKEKVMPNGSPAFVNPIKIGIEEQEQNGVTVPKRAAIIFPAIPLYFDNILFVLSGGK